MASIRWSGEVAAGSKSTVALFIIRLTVASATPGCRCRARWTRAWQAAQVIPETGMLIFWVVVELGADIACIPPRGISYHTPTPYFKPGELRRAWRAVHIYRVVPIVFLSFLAFVRTTRNAVPRSAGE